MKDEFQNLPNEFRDTKEIDNKYKDEFDHLNIAKTVGKSNLKQRYNKMLKVMKLVTSVSLATTAISTTIPTIIPIIRVDASEEKEEIVIKEDELLKELSGVWNVSGFKHVLIVDEQEIVLDDGNLTDVSYLIEIEGDNAYLTYLENGENLNSSLLEKIDDKTLYYHQIRQNGDEYDVYVYIEEDIFVVKVVGQTVYNDILSDDITYYYCTKEGSDYIYTPVTTKPEENNCMTCNGEGFITCIDCEGLGHILCTECNGEGYLEENDEICAGTGECIYCLGIGSVEETIINEETLIEETLTKECEYCQGTGLCSSCNGTGHVICSNCTNTEIEDNIPGYIICKTCEGKGQIVCENCLGSGKITETQEENEKIEE